jgi:anti-sigma factor RsiW
MNCEEFNKLIDTYLDEELNENESSEFEKHLESCQRCQMEVMSFEKCKRLIRKIFTEENPPASIRKKIFKKTGCCDPNTLSFCPPEKKE